MVFVAVLKFPKVVQLKDEKTGEILTLSILEAQCGHGLLQQALTMLGLQG